MSFYDGYSYADEVANIDCYMQKALPDTNTGPATPVMLWGYQSDKDVGALFPILRFDLASSLPSGAHHLGGELHIYIESTTGGEGPYSFFVHTVEPEDSYGGAKAWVEGEVTWNSSKTGSAWGIPGGDVALPKIMRQGDTEASYWWVWDLTLNPGSGYSRYDFLTQHVFGNRSGWMDVICMTAADANFYFTCSSSEKGSNEPFVRIFYAPEEVQVMM